jgi:hypothetical protein
MKNNISRISIAAALVVTGCSLVLASGLAMAEPQEGRCSNQTLLGDYGGVAEGVLLNIPGLPSETQFRGLTMTHFDGKGNLSWVEHTVINGRPAEQGWTEATGTYTVNEDCTGMAVVDTPNSPVPLSLAMVVVKRGAEIHTVLNTDAVASTFIKVK